jgi:hypothetical protein
MHDIGQGDDRADDEVPVIRQFDRDHWLNVENILRSAALSAPAVVQIALKWQAKSALRSNRHREERSDAAIQGRKAPDDFWIASLRSQ